MNTKNLKSLAVLAGAAALASSASTPPTPTTCADPGAHPPPVIDYGLTEKAMVVDLHG